MATLTDDQIIVTRIALPRVAAAGVTARVVADPDGTDGGDSDGSDK